MDAMIVLGAGAIVTYAVKPEWFTNHLYHWLGLHKLGK